MGDKIQIQVLGYPCCQGTRFSTPSLLLDGNVLLDAGGFGGSLTLVEQIRIDHVLLSHAHHDHVRDLSGFADLIVGRRSRPVRVHAARESLQVLRRHFFNNRLWPDFFSIPSPESPTLVEEEFQPGTPFEIGRMRITAVPVSHPVQTLGFVVSGPDGSFAYSGDTGPTDEFWRVVNACPDLRLLMVECKFPNALQMVADAAGHLTPRKLKGELAKLDSADIPVVIYHVKPDRYGEVLAEIAELKDERIRMMDIGDRFDV